MIYALGAMSTKERWWRWYLAAAASVTIVQAAWSLFYAIDADLIPRNVSLVLDNGIKLVSFLLVVYFMMLVTKDLATRRRRDWLHWAAVLAETIFTILPWTYFLLYYSLQQSLTKNDRFEWVAARTNRAFPKAYWTLLAICRIRT